MVNGLLSHCSHQIAHSGYFLYVYNSIIANTLCLHWVSTLSLFVTRVGEGDYSHLGGLLSILRQHSSLLHLPPLSPEETKQVHETMIAVTADWREIQFWWTSIIPLQDNHGMVTVLLSHRVNLLTRGAYLGNNRVRSSLLAAIDVDLVYFSKLFVSWNAMEDIVKAVHVRDCACYTNACTCPTSSASDEVQ